MKVQLIILASILSLVAALPTNSPVEDTAGSNSAPKVVRDPLTKRDLYCHSGYPADLCESQYGVQCWGGELFAWSWPDDGRSCTSRQCWCN